MERVVQDAGVAPCIEGFRLRCGGDTVARRVVATTSRGLGWNGISAESGFMVGTIAYDARLAGHFVGINLGDGRAVVERKSASGFVRAEVPPGGLWVHPAGMPVSQRGAPRWWGAIEVSPACLRRLLGRDVEVIAAFGVVDAPLATMVRALVDETRSRGESGPLYADGIGAAIAARLARRFAASEHRVEACGVLTQPRLARVVDKIEASLGDAVTVDELAAVVGLSPAHFAREFKRCTREAPHAFVLRRRLERAQRLLATGQGIAEAAAVCGFTDQAHLTRAFKKRFGVTPGVFVRQWRGVAAAPS